MATDRVDADMAETLLNWDAVVQSHANDGPVPLRKMSVSRREAFLTEMRAIQAVAHALSEALRLGGEPGEDLVLKITEVDRRVFNQLIRPRLPEHWQLQNRGGVARATLVPREEISPLPFAQILELADLVLCAVRGAGWEIGRCAYARCDRGSYKRARLFVRETGQRSRKRYCCKDCRAADESARAEAEESGAAPAAAEPAPRRKRAG